MYTAQQIAQGFISLTDIEKEDTVSNLKLQKLLYYAQGIYLAMHNEVLFDEDIVAWQYGPVVPEVYHKYKDYGPSHICKSEADTLDAFDEDTAHFISEIYRVFGQYSALKLMEMTHNEKPWMETAKNEVISTELMKEYFKGWLVKDGEKAA